MEPESQRFEKIELQLSEHNEKIITHDKPLAGIPNLLQTGIRMLVEMETNMSALADSETRLYGASKTSLRPRREPRDSLKRFLTAAAMAIRLRNFRNSV